MKNNSFPPLEVIFVLCLFSISTHSFSQQYRKYSNQFLTKNMEKNKKKELNNEIKELEIDFDKIDISHHVYYDDSFRFSTGYSDEEWAAIQDEIKFNKKNFENGQTVIHHKKTLDTVYLTIPSFYPIVAPLTTDW